MAGSASSCALYQAAARRCSSLEAVGFEALEAAAQQLGEEVVVAEALVAVVEGADEEVLAREVGEDGAGVGAAGHGRAERRRQLVEDRRLEQELLQVGGLTLEHLVRGGSRR